MPVSMTGFGRATLLMENNQQMTVEVKTVNHRFLEISTKLPHILQFFELELKPLVKNYFSRGRINIRVSVDGNDESGISGRLNHNLIVKIYQDLTAVKQKLNLDEPVKLQHIIQIPGAISYQEPDDIEQLFNQVKILVKEASEKAYGMRKAEGQEISRDIENKINQLKEYLHKIRELYPQSVIQKKQKIRQMFSDLGKQIDSETQIRLHQELTLLADKLNIEEELVRLDSHLDCFNKFLSSTSPIGKSMDFLLQEILREVNTIASKSQHAEISQQVVVMKDLIESIREQVQNIE
ncbi:MAG: YicC/YloC family endoribonuclease [bacterium]